VSRLANVVLALVSVLIALVAVEIGLRLLRPSGLSPELQALVYEPDPELGYRYRPGASARVVRGFEIDTVVHINDLGFHDVARTLPPRGGPRLVAIGDSFTSAKHVPVAQGWTQTLERALRADGWPDAQVWNLGLDGTGTDVHVALLERWVDRIQPELVILAFYANDVQDVAERRKYREDYRGYVLGWLDEAQRDALRAFVDAHAPGPLGRFVYAHVWTSRFFVGLTPGLELLRTNYVTPARVGLASDLARPDAMPLEGWIGRLEALAARRRGGSDGAPVPPKRHPRGSMRRLERGLEPGIFAALDVVDVQPAMAAAVAARGQTWDDLYWRRDDHFDAEGYALFGATLAPEIARRLPPR
jgi:lysophospholipase L1-like esterase